MVHMPIVAWYLMESKEWIGDMAWHAMTSYAMVCYVTWVGLAAQLQRLYKCIILKPLLKFQRNVLNLPASSANEIRI